MPVETRTIQQAYKFALAPTPRQERAFTSHVGGARYAYNWGLARVIDALNAREREKAESGESTTQVPSHFDLCKTWTAYKDAHADDLPPPEGERPTNTGWVGQNFVGTYQAALRDAHAAWKAFFASRSGKRAGRRVGRPRFKKKGRVRETFQVHGPTLDVVDTRHVKLPKVGRVRTHEPTRKLLRRLRNGTARLVRGTVSRDSRGRWHVALTVEVQREVRTAPSRRQQAGGTIGIDLGVRDLVTLSTGESRTNPRYLPTALARLQHAQRALSRCDPSSGRRRRAQQRVARMHGRVAALRRDTLSKLATELVHSHHTIGVEGWDIAQTLTQGSRNGLPRKIARQRNLALASAGLGELRWMLHARAEWYGATVIVADKNDQTSRTCSRCGAVKTKPVPPAQDEYRCTACGIVTDRRVNSARLVAAIADAHHNDAPSGGESRNGRGGDIRPDTSRRGRQSPTKRQASTRSRGQTGASGP